MSFFTTILQAQPGGSAFGAFVPMILVVALFYFLIIRPMQKQRKEQETMRSNLKAGDEILTTGGLYGTVAKLRQDERRLHVRIADGVQVVIDRDAVSSVVPPKSGG